MNEMRDEKMDGCVKGQTGGWGNRREWSFQTHKELSDEE